MFIKSTNTDGFGVIINTDEITVIEKDAVEVTVNFRSGRIDVPTTEFALFESILCAEYNREVKSRMDDLVDKLDDDAAKGSAAGPYRSNEDIQALIASFMQKYIGPGHEESEESWSNDSSSTTDDEEQAYLT